MVTELRGQKRVSYSFLSFHLTIVIVNQCKLRLKTVELNGKDVDVNGQPCGWKSLEPITKSKYVGTFTTANSHFSSLKLAATGEITNDRFDGELVVFEKNCQVKEHYQFMATREEIRNAGLPWALAKSMVVGTKDLERMSVRSFCHLQTKRVPI